MGQLTSVVLKQPNRRQQNGLGEGLSRRIAILATLV